MAEDRDKQTENDEVDHEDEDVEAHQLAYNDSDDEREKHDHRGRHDHRGKHVH
jgi:hypothetical protein